MGSNVPEILGPSSRTQVDGASEVAVMNNGSWSRSTEGAFADRSPWEDPSPAPVQVFGDSATVDRWQFCLPSEDKDNDAVGPVLSGGRRGESSRCGGDSMSHKPKTTG